MNSTMALPNSQAEHSGISSKFPMLNHGEIPNHYMSKNGFNNTNTGICTQEIAFKWGKKETEARQIKPARFIQANIASAFNPHA